MKTVRCSLKCIFIRKMPNYLTVSESERKNWKSKDELIASIFLLFFFFFLCAVEQYRKSRKLKSLGMPHYVAHGSHEVNGMKHRFVVMPRYSRDVWSYFLENGKKLPQPAIFRIAIQMVSVWLCRNISL